MLPDSPRLIEDARSSGLAILRADGSSRLVAQRAFREGEVILTLDGVLVTAPSRHSIQIGIGLHLEKPADVEGVAEMDRYLWRFLEHSCAPCAAFRGPELVAVRAIDPFEPVTFDYLTQEYDMASPFPCACGSSDCVGEVRGFRHLPSERRERLQPRLAAHVLELARRDGLC